MKKGNIKKFQTNTSLSTREFTFPFNVLDDTPGGENLGRIRWCFEFFPARKRKNENKRRIGKLVVWATQTRDKRYDGVQFEFKTHAELFLVNTLGKNFTISDVQFCDEHKGAVVISAYPENHHKELIVRPDSSIFFELEFN